MTAESLPTNSRYLRSYWAETPFPLAFERTWECRLMARRQFLRPVLDVGCGDGLFARMLFRAPLDTGVDPNERELQHASVTSCYTELIACRGDCIPKPNGHYQTILSNSVLEHIADLDSVLAELRRLLAPGGRLYVTVPTHQYEQYTAINQLLSALRLDGAAARYRAFFNRFWRHYHCETPDGWNARFVRSGFHVLERVTYGPRWSCLLNDLLVPFCLPNMVLKKFANRWTILPSMRRVTLAPLATLGEALARGADQSEEGGLVFFALCRDAEVGQRRQVA